MSAAGAGYGEILAMEVLDRLHHLDLVAAGERGRSAVEVAEIRDEMRRTVAIWRRLLAQHLPATDAGRHCPECRSWGGRRRRRWPCPVWTQAHTRLMARYPPPRRPAPPRPATTVTAPLPVIRQRLAPEPSEAG